MLVKRSITLSGHRTSIALEAEFWSMLEQMATSHNMGLATFIAALDADRDIRQPLTSRLRVVALRGSHPLLFGND